MKLAAEAPPLAAPPVSADVVSGLQSKPAPMHPRLRTVTDEKPKR